MKQEEKDLLLQDLCSRLLYGVKCSFGVDDAIYEICGINPVCCGASEIQATHIKSGINGDFAINACKPYLFPLSSMTEEQRKEYHNLCSVGTDECGDIIYFDTYESIDYLNKNKFDYRYLIPMGLATDATTLNVY